MNRSYTIINLAYLIFIPTWILLTLAQVDFDPGFTWSPQMDIFVSIEFTILNMLLLFISAAAMSAIGTILLKKYKKTKKNAPLLLGMFNIILGGGLVWEGIRKYTTFVDPLTRYMAESIIFIAIMWSMLFLFLFLQEIFSKNSSFKNHRVSHSIFISIVITSTIFFIGLPDLIPLEISLYLAFSAMISIIIPLGIWQTQACFKLKKKTDEKRIKTGLSMIGYSAIIYLMITASIALKKLFFPLDLLLSVLILLLSGVTFMGYIYPSRGNKEGNNKSTVKEI
ncbi:MAG: hypothetical protein ACTSUE_22080 [Promethearchaeota archaeon]